MGKLTFTESDFQKAAIQFRKELLRLPIMQLDEILPYVTVRPGVRYKELVGESSVNAQLAPYSKGRRTDSELKITMRALETFFGAVNADFEPNSAIQTLLGHRAVSGIGDAQASTPTAKEVLALVAATVGGHLNASLWNAKRNDSGATTADLFNGWDTITAAEIAAGNLAEAKKNYLKLTKQLTAANIVDSVKEVIYNMDVLLRKEDCFMFCPHEIADMYNEGYLLTHNATPYNDKYHQVFAEGSNNKLTIVPLTSKAGSTYIHIAPKRNLLIGVDQLSDKETVRVKEYDPDVLTFSMKMFFGTQFESIDSRRMMTVELADAPASEEEEEEEGGEKKPE